MAPQHEQLGEFWFFWFQSCQYRLVSIHMQPGAEHSSSRSFVYPFTLSTKMSPCLLAQSLGPHLEYCICSTSWKFTCNLMQNTAYPEHSLTHLHRQPRWVNAIHIYIPEFWAILLSKTIGLGLDSRWADKSRWTEEKKQLHASDSSDDA